MSGVGAVVVTHNNVATIKECITSLLKYGISQVVVVDSASQDSTVPVIRDMGVKVVSLKENKGFGFAANQGVAALQEECGFVFFCNPDAVLLTPLGAAIDKVKNISKLAVVGFRLEGVDGKVEVDARGNEPTLISLITRKLVVSSKAKQKQVDWVSGGAMIVRRSVFERIGGFDDRFFLYWEDVDLCRRVRQQGCGVEYMTDIRVQHLRGHSLQDLQDKTRFYDISADRYFQKHYAAPIWILQRIFRFFYRLVSPRVH